MALYSRLALCQRNPPPIQIPPTYSHSNHHTGDHSSQGNRYQTRPMFTCTQLKSLPPTTNCHPTPDSSSQETGNRQDPCPHTPVLNLSSFRLRSLTLYPRLALYQRNPLPIQIPPTSSNSHHLTWDHSLLETGTKQDPCPHTPQLKPPSLRFR